VPRGLKLRPVKCMERWLQAASVTEGRVFRAVLRGRNGGRSACGQSHCCRFR
jgi:hypothetical protein